MSYTSLRRAGHSQATVADESVKYRIRLEFSKIRGFFQDV
jgi:hypothetical protein